MIRHLATTIALVACLCAHAQTTTTFAYASPQSETEPSGTGKKETYDVAIALTNPALANKSITAITIPVIASDKVSDLSVWVADELQLQLVDGRNTNVVSQRWEAQMPADGYIQWVRVELPTPYVIPAAGTYVGYSLTVNEINLTEGTQVPIVTAVGAKEGGFWLHTSRSFLDWADRSAELNVVALTQVEIEGQFYRNAATLGAMPQVYVAAAQTQTVSIPVHNIGMEPIESLSYVSTLGDEQMEGSVTLATPIPAVFAYFEDVEFSLPSSDEKGAKPYSVTITGVNGADNEAMVGVSGEATATVLKFVPRHLASVEEFTGTWCGWCPYGLVAMELMGRMYPDFIGVAYHDNDPMAMKAGYPPLSSGYPSCAVDRTLITHPYEASGQSGVFSMPQVWEEYCSGFCPVGIFLEARLDEASATVTVNSTVEWADVCPDPEADYRVEYILVADGLTGTTGDWYQHNYFCTEPMRADMEMWCNGQPYMSGIVYNDVAILTSGINGVPGSVTTTELEHPNAYSHTFDLSQAINYKDKPIPYDPDKLRVVALLLKGEGCGVVVNAAKCDVLTGAALDDVRVDTQRSLGIYNLQGMPMDGDNLSPGIYIVNGALKYIK